MGNERLKTFFWAAFLALAAAVGNVGSIATGFHLEDLHIWVLAVSWALAAVVFGLCFTKRVGLYPLIGVGVLACWLWQKGPLDRSTELLVYKLSSVYHTAYGWDTLSWSNESFAETDVTTALCWLGLGILILVMHCVINRRSLLVAAVAAFLPLVSCMVVTDTPPHALYLYLVFLSVILLLLTQTVRRRDAAQGNRLCAIVALPVALILGALFLLNPEAEYDHQSDAQKLEDAIVELFTDTPQPTLPQVTFPEVQLPPILEGFTSEDVNLSWVGPKSKNYMNVMTVTAPQSGTLYLRGISYDSYDGSSWSCTVEDGTDALTWPAAGTLTPIGDITISTVTTHDVLYRPYYPAHDLWYEALTEGAVPNTGNIKTYSVAQAVLSGSERLQDFDRNTDPYLELPSATREWAQALAAQILGEKIPLSRYDLTHEKAAAIAAYVRNSARYSLDTGYMPAGEEDFARWFLESSDTGYCVHFATATTLLLRAAGFPARYVTGYTFQAQAKEPVTVRGYNSHAWVEYRLPFESWRPLESTPADLGDSPVTPTTQPGDPTETTGGPPEDTTQPDVTFPPKPTDSPESTHQGTQPDTPGTQQPGTQETPSRLWTFLEKALGLLLPVLLAAALVLAQWQLRLRLRLKRLYSGRPNQRALARWQDVVFMSRLLGKHPEDSLFQLAQKAKYSQHTLTAEELALFNQALAALRRELQQKPLPHRLLHTLILALY